MLTIVTGAIGIGKSTVCQKVVKIAESQGYSCGGVVTYKDPDKSIVIEDIESGESMTLASTESVYPGPRIGWYYFNPDGIDFGIRALDRGRRTDILVVDEIGHLELRGDGFINAIEIVRERACDNCIVVIRSNLLADFLPRLGGAPLIFETSEDNREQLPEEICGRLDGLSSRKIVI